MSHRIAVIGSGITGLTCARILAEAGHDVVIFDKGRGLGGRMATRRIGEDMAFDHGAQYFRARGDEFGGLVAQAEAAGAIGRWHLPDDPEPAFVGIPGMNGLAKHMAEGLDIRLGTEITAVTAKGDGWLLTHGDGQTAARHLVSTVPVVQARALLGHLPGIDAALDPVRSNPCWALMIAFETALDAPVGARPRGRTTCMDRA